MQDHMFHFIDGVLEYAEQLVEQPPLDRVKGLFPFLQHSRRCSDHTQPSIALN